MGRRVPSRPPTALLPEILALQVLVTGNEGMVARIRIRLLSGPPHEAGRQALPAGLFLYMPLHASTGTEAAVPLLSHRGRGHHEATFHGWGENRVARYRRTG